MNYIYLFKSFIPIAIKLEQLKCRTYSRVVFVVDLALDATFI